MNPLSTSVWATGADGEAATARYLAELEPDRYLVLHDLRIPRSRANIDHLVIGPSGVFVADTKTVRGSLEVRGRELWVGRRRGRRLVESVRWQTEVAGGALAPTLAGVKVRPVLAFHRAEFPLLRRRLEVDGVSVVRASDLVALISEGVAVLAPDAVSRLGAPVEERLEPMRTSVDLSEGYRA